MSGVLTPRRMPRYPSPIAGSEKREAGEGRATAERWRWRTATTGCSKAPIAPPTKREEYVLAGRSDRYWGDLVGRAADDPLRGEWEVTETERRRLEEHLGIALDPDARVYFVGVGAIRDETPLSAVGSRSVIWPRPPAS